MITLLCVVVSAVLLGVGLATDVVALSYVALVVALAGIGVWVVASRRARHDETSDATNADEATAEEPAQEEDPDPTSEAVPHAADAAAQQPATVTKPTTAKTSQAADDEATPQQPDEPEDITVVVVPGRRRYHHTDCANLNSQAREELTLVEAKDEGFTACTVCSA